MPRLALAADGPGAEEYEFIVVVTNADHNTPGNLRAKVQFKLRDVSKGTIQDKRVGATDDIETATLDRRNVEYLYSEPDGHVLMDLETYDQNTIPKEVFGDDILYLKPNTAMTAMFHEGKVVSYELPKTVDLEVTDTPPIIKGATATNQLKEAKLTGALGTDKFRPAEAEEILAALKALGGAIRPPPGTAANCAIAASISASLCARMAVTSSASTSRCSLNERR